MTPENYIIYIVDEFERGETFVEIPTDEPQALVDKLYYRSRKMDWHFKTTLDSVIVMPEKPTKAKQAGKHVCGPDCDRFGFCIQKWNESRRKDHKRNRKYIVAGGTVPQARIGRG